MPARPFMTWEPGPRRWRKLYRGKLFTVSCRQLGVPDTKNDSYQAANAWWVARRAEIDGQKPPHLHEWWLTEARRRLSIAAKLGEPRVAAALRSEINRIEQGGTPTFLSEYDPLLADPPPPDHDCPEELLHV